MDHLTAVITAVLKFEVHNHEDNIDLINAKNSNCYEKHSNLNYLKLLHLM